MSEKGYDKIVVTIVGTSLLSNYIRSSSDEEIGDHFKEFNDYDKKGDCSEMMWQQNFACIAKIKEKIINWALVKQDPTMLSAELNSIEKIAKELGTNLTVYLLTSDTVMSRLAAEVIKELVDSRIAFKSIWLKETTMIFDSEDDVITDMQVVDPDRLEEKGLEALLIRIDQVCAKRYQDVAFNITGGYKALIPYLTVIAQVFEMPVYYIHEDADKLICIPQLPFEFDYSLIEENYLAFERIKPSIKSTSNKEDQKMLGKTRSLKEFVADISENHKEAEAEIKRMREAGLIYIQESNVGLTTIGKVLYKRHEMLYLSKSYHRANLFSGLVELKMFQYFYEKYCNYQGKIRNSVKHIYNGKICEIDLLVMHNDYCIVAEIKLTSETMQRYKDIMKSIKKKVTNESFLDYWNNELIGRSKEYRVYIISHKELPKKFLSMINDFNEANNEIVRKLGIKWYLVKLEPSYKNKFEWEINDENISYLS